MSALKTRYSCYQLSDSIADALKDFAEENELSEGIHMRPVYSTASSVIYVVFAYDAENAIANIIDFTASSYDAVVMLAKEERAHKERLAKGTKYREEP